MPKYQNLTIPDLKRLAKLHASKTGVKLAAAQLHVAVEAGFDDFTDAVRKLSVVKAARSKNKIDGSNKVKTPILAMPGLGSVLLYANASYSDDADEAFLIRAAEELAVSTPAHQVLISGHGSSGELATLSTNRQITILGSSSLDDSWGIGLQAAKEILNAGGTATLILSRVWTCSDSENEFGMAATAKINRSRLSRPSDVVFGNVLRAVEKKLNLADLQPHRERLRVIMVTRPCLDDPFRLADDKTRFMGGQALGYTASHIWLESEGGKIQVLKSHDPLAT
jgi:hypothetical protein